MRIRMGEMVRRTGVSERLLRYYEAQGLLAPTRLPSGYREYTEADVATVRRIRTLLTAGLSTSVIARVLPCVRDDGPRLAPTCSDLVRELRDERARIDAAIDELAASRDLLDTVIAAGPADLARPSGA